MVHLLLSCFSRKSNRSSLAQANSKIILWTKLTKKLKICDSSNSLRGDLSNSLRGDSSNSLRGDSSNSLRTYTLETLQKVVRMIATFKRSPNFKLLCKKFVMRKKPYS